MNNGSFKVDFVGIGAPKCGTTWISAMLHEHPDICHSRRSEVSFFDSPTRRDREGLSSYKTGGKFPFIDDGAEVNFFDAPHLYKKGLEFYKTFFSHCKPDQIKGEFTPGYIDSPVAAERIKKHNPNVKLIVCLRNPIERAYSQYSAQARRGKNILWLSSFDEIQRNQNNPYFKDGMYYAHLKQYIEMFGRKNILILILEDAKKDPLRFVKGIYSFLGVRDDFVPPSLTKKVNATADKAAAHSLTLNQWLLYGKPGAILSKYLPFYKEIRRFLRKTGIYRKTKKIVERLNRNNRKKGWIQPPMSQKTREFLQKAYRDDISQLEKLLNRKLDFWM